MKKLITYSVNKPFTVIAITLIIAIWGWKSFTSLPIDAVPDITNPQVQVITNVQGLVPEDIERRITFPIESALNGISGVNQIRSITRLGIAHITVIFDDQTDIYRARQLVNERLSSIQSDLPKGVVPKMGPISNGLGEIFHYQVDAKKKKTGEERVLQLMEIRALQDWVIKPRLLRVKGVTEINTIGGHEKQYHIQPYVERMHELGVTFKDISEAIRLNNGNEGGGYIQQSAEQFLVQANGLLKSIHDIENVPIKVNKNLRTIKIKDIAKVKLSTELRNGAALVDGEESVLGTILMLMGENSRIVARRVGEELVQIQKVIPPDYEIKPLYDRAEMVDATLLTVEKNLLFGSLLVVVFLLLLVGNLPAALITSLTIPLSLLMTFILMKYRGVSGNLMSLGSLDFGVIIESAVIVVDNCLRVLGAKRKELGTSIPKEQIKTSIIDATIQVIKPALFGQIIITLVFVPIFALKGVEGKMFIPMASTFVFALISALVLSFSIVPALCSLFLNGELKEKGPWLMRMIEKIFAPLIHKSFQMKAVVVSISFILLLFSLGLFSRMGGEFIPQLNEGSIALDVTRPMTISVDKAIELQHITEKAILEFKEVAHVFSRIGTSAIPADPQGINLGDTFIMLKPKDQWPVLANGHKRTKDELTRDIAQMLETQVIGQRLMYTQPIQMRFNELLEGTRADVSIKIYGDDFHLLEKTAREIQSVVEKIKGTGQVQAQVLGRSSLLLVKPRAGDMNTVGFGNITILDPIGYGYKGDEVGQIFNGVQRFPIVVRLGHHDRDDYDNIKDLPVSPEGNDLILKLGQLADINFTETFHSIFREQGLRRTAVLISLKDRDVQSYVDEALEVVEKNVKLPQGVSLEWGGNYKNLQNAKSSLKFLVPLTMAAIFFIIYSAFKNWLAAIIVFSCIPLSLVGGILALYIRDMPFSISAGVGFIALSGIAVINGVLLVSYFNQQKLKGKSGESMVRAATLDMLRPVMMTALVDAFGFLPIMMSTGLGAEVQRPLATVVVGGVMSATILAVIVIPIFYLIFEKKIEKIGLVDAH